MTTLQISEFLYYIKRALERGSFTTAISELKALSEATRTSHEIKERIAQLDEHYSLMKRFALDGYDDPGRRQMLDEFHKGILELSDMILRNANIPDNPASYYTAVRNDGISNDSLSTLTEQYETLLNRFSMSRYGFSVPSKSGNVSQSEIEQAERRIFIKIWTMFPLSDSSVNQIERLLASEVVSIAAKQFFVSALFLGGLQFFDARRLELLASIYLRHEETALGIQSLCDLLLLLWKWRDRSLSKRLTDMLKSLDDKESTILNVQMAYMQIIRTIDTNRISREIKEQIEPAVQKLSPDLKKLADIQELTGDAPEANPQWGELLKNSGLEEKLKHLSEMQQNGDDVMMTTFAPLKNYPFFNSVENWFLPFDTCRSEFNDLPQELLDMVKHSNFLCDSDKYSLALSLNRFTPGMIDSIRKQLLSNQGIDFAEVESSGYADVTRKAMATNHLQSIYRFFNLYRRKIDFTNLFSNAIDLFEIDALNSVLTDNGMITAVAEFYLKNGYYKEALSTFSRLSDEEIFLSAELLQKIGYCRQRLGDYAGAVDAYSKSELLDGRNKWTLKRLAYCHKALGNIQEALDYFKRLLEMIPDDETLTLNAAYCQMRLKNFGEAVKLYYKVEFMNENTNRTWRPMAWCSLLLSDLKRAGVYFEKILLDEPTATDYINYGHYLLADKRPREAVNAYLTALQLTENKDFLKLKSAIDTDRQLLSNLNIERLLWDIVLDEVETTSLK